MKRLLILILTGCWAVAVAQVPSDEEPPAEAVEQEQVAEETAGDGAAAQPGELAPEEGGEEDPAALPPIVETNPIPEPPPQESESELAEEEFEPGEEISEDYPVPLPSDI